MAYTQSDFIRDLAAYTAGAAIGVTRSRKFLAFAAKKGIQLGAVATTRAAVPAARGAGQLALAGARRYPAAAIGLAGYGAYKAGAFDPLEQAIEEEVQRRLGTIPPGPPIGQAIQEEIYSGAAKLAPARKVSAYAKGVKAGMKALKASNYSGPKGKISNAKKAFSTVAKTVAAVRKGKKVRRTGATGVVAKAASKVPGIKSIKVRK